MSLRASALALAALLGPLLGTGCGLEGVLSLYGGQQYTQNVSTLRGAVDLPSPTLTVLDAAGEEITPFTTKVENGRYEVQLYAGDYSGLRVRAEQSERILESFVPFLGKERTVEGVDLTVRSTATVKVVEGLLGPSNKTLAKLSDELVCIMGKKLDARFAAPGPLAEVLRIMERVNGEASLELATDARVFQSPAVTVDQAGTYTVTRSALNPNWVSRANYDYDNNGNANPTTVVFDRIFVDALRSTDLQAPPNPALVRTLFTVNFNDGRKNGACGNIERFRWVRDEPGRSMFFVGGIHTSSPVQDTVVDAMLGNRGGWTPNQIRMYDDGTNGDEKAGDGIWSVAFDLPRGVRVGYKYTWGKQGMSWTGTEEWPGNQRILEVKDLNGDGYVTRFDDFGDEASNKDLGNLNPRAAGGLDWTEDLDGDGRPEANEAPPDIDNNCTPDAFLTPDWVSPLTVSCQEFVAP
jgi:hypothetical protein